MKRKCTACGSENLSEEMRDFDIYTHITCLAPDSFQQFKFKVSSFVCLDCGHIELYSDDIKNSEILAQRNNEAKVKANEVKNKLIFRINECKKDIDNLNTEISNINKYIESLKIKSNDENITVREQKEILNQIPIEQNKINIIVDRIDDYKCKLKDLNNQLNKYDRTEINEIKKQDLPLG